MVAVTYFSIHAVSKMPDLLVLGFCLLYKQVFLWFYIPLLSSRKTGLCSRGLLGPNFKAQPGPEPGLRASNGFQNPLGLNPTIHTKPASVPLPHLWVWSGGGFLLVPHLQPISSHFLLLGAAQWWLCTLLLLDDTTSLCGVCCRGESTDFSAHSTAHAAQ